MSSPPIGSSLTASDDDLIAQFARLRCRSDVAEILEIPDAFLRTILYGHCERKAYSEFTIPKKNGGRRTITVPPTNLRILQQKLARILLIVHSPKPVAHAFLRKRSIITNAESHVGKRYVLNVDLHNFFPSIHVGRILAVLGSAPYSLGEEAAVTIAQLCCVDAGWMPQGAPTSPIVSNIICRSLDDQLLGLAKRHQLVYTRYADDITFSTTRSHFPKEVACYDEIRQRVTLGDSLIKAIHNQRFAINYNKVRLQTPITRQEVTGLTVNEFPNVSRRFIRKLRGMLHCWRKYGYQQAQQHYFMIERRSGDPDGSTFYRVVRGHLDFLKMVRGEHDPLYRKLTSLAHELDMDRFHTPVAIEDALPTPLRGMRLGIPRWTVWSRKYFNSIFQIETTTAEGDLRSGSAFLVSPGKLATAGHNLKYHNVRVSYPLGEYATPIGFMTHPQNGVDVGMLKMDPADLSGATALPTQCRIPEVGEPVAVVGYPVIPQRHPTIVMHTGTVEALPINYMTNCRFIQVSIHSGGGLSGAPLVDQRGFVLGIMTENVFLPTEHPTPSRPFGQAVPIEYLTQFAHRLEWN